MHGQKNIKRKKMLKSYWITLKSRMLEIERKKH